MSNSGASAKRREDLLQSCYKYTPIPQRVSRKFKCAHIIKAACGAVLFEKKWINCDSKSKKNIKKPGALLVRRPGPGRPAPVNRSAGAGAGSK